MSRPKSQYSMPMDVLQAVARLSRMSMRSVSLKLGFVQNNLAMFLKGYPTLSAANLEKVYMAYGFDEDGQFRSDWVYDWTVGADLEPLRVALAYACMQGWPVGVARKFNLAKVLPTRATKTDPTQPRNGALYLISCPQFHIRVIHRTGTSLSEITPLGPDVLSEVRWPDGDFQRPGYDPRVIFLEPSVYDTWVAGKSISPADLDDQLAHPGEFTWDQLLAQFKAAGLRPNDVAEGWAEYRAAKARQLINDVVTPSS